MCIYLLNRVPKIRQRLAEVGVEVVAIAVPTLGELYYGAYCSKRVEENLGKIRHFLVSPGPRVLPLDDAAMQAFGRLKAGLRQTGLPVGDADLQIAGVAVSRELTLVTNNVRHYGRLPGISIENWATD
jgi:predicted nucleic acid-binding protein